MIDTDMGFGAEVRPITPFRLVHLRIALAVLVLGRTGGMKQGGVDDGALTQ